MSLLLENSLIVILFTLSVLVFVHELGHYLVGRMCGMGVESFAIGFGPAIAAFRVGGTQYRLGIIPLGGYVQFAGAMPHLPVADIFVGKELYRAALWKRTLMI